MCLQRQMQKESAENSTVIMCMLVLTLGHLYHRDGFDEVSAKKWGHRKQYVYTYNQVCMEQKNDTVIWVLTWYLHVRMKKTTFLFHFFEFDVHI